MNTHVDTHLLRLAESTAARIALKRFFSRVGADVLAQVVSSSKSFAAIRTLEHGDRALWRHYCHSQRLN